MLFNYKYNMNVWSQFIAGVEFEKKECIMFYDIRCLYMKYPVLFKCHKHLTESYL